MHRRVLIKNVTIVNEGKSFKGALVIDDDRIDEIFVGDSLNLEIPADEVVDGNGGYLLPGIIDTHVHFRDPGLTHKGDILSESRAAAAGGVTTYLDMPNTLPQTTTQAAFEEKLNLAAEKSFVNYGFFFGATCDNLDALQRLNKRKVCGIKLFMGSSTGGMLVDKESALRKIFEQPRLPIVTHCEDSAIIAENMRQLQEELGVKDPDVKYHSRIRSEEACYKSTQLAVKLAKESGARLHVAHISTAKELELFSKENPNITAEVCLPHLLYTEADYERLGTRIKCNPAVKTLEDRTALRTALTSGLIYSVATDHAPHALSEKRGGAISAVSGIPMLQYSLLAMLGLVDEGVLSIERMVELMCHHPADLFSIENRGYIREGYKADLVLVAPNSPWTLTPNKIESKCNWSPLEGHTFFWQIKKTYCNGALIYNNGSITNENFRGQAVTFCR